MHFQLRVSGPRACFARPEFRVDRISYDIITPLAARAILDAIYWRPQMRWRIDAIHVLNPILFARHRGDGDNVPAHSWVISLIDVDYLIDLHFDLVEPETADNNAALHAKMFLKRVRSGSYFRPPFLGLPAYPASIVLVEGNEAPPPCSIYSGTHDMGWITHDLDDAAPHALRFFRATMENGKLLVPPAGSAILTT